MELLAVGICSFAGGALVTWLLMRGPAQVPVSPVRPVHVPQSSVCPKCKGTVYAGHPEQYTEQHYADGSVSVVFHCPSCDMDFARQFDLAS